MESGLLVIGTRPPIEAVKENTTGVSPLHALLLYIQNGTWLVCMYATYSRTKNTSQTVFLGYGCRRGGDHRRRLTREGSILPVLLSVVVQMRLANRCILRGKALGPSKLWQGVYRYRQRSDLQGLLQAVRQTSQAAS